MLSAVTLEVDNPSQLILVLVICTLPVLFSYPRGKYPVSAAPEEDEEEDVEEPVQTNETWLGNEHIFPLSASCEKIGLVMSLVKAIQFSA